MAKTLFNYLFLTAGDMSANISSASVSSTLIDGYSIYAVWTGAPVGVLKLQVSDTGLDADYVDLDGSSTPVNGAGNFFWEVTTANYDFMRLVYTRTSGTGSVTARACGKGEPQ